MRGKIGADIIGWYLQRKKRLCLLDSAKGLPPKLRGKKPLRNDWTKVDETPTALKNHCSAGGNLGFVMGPGDLVIDVDPRNGGAESLKILEKDVGNVDLRSIFPVVETGGGGIHIYTSKSPADEIRKKSVRYPGIEFLTEGSHCVIPGSYHFLAGRFYEFDELSAYDEAIFPPAPEALLRHIRRIKDPDEPLHKSARCPDLTNDELVELLSSIDPEDYRKKHDDWLHLMFACHHATGGDGRKAFVDWCVRDRQYAADEGLIIHRWDSVLDDEENLITYRTLMKAVRDAGGEVPEEVDRKCKVAEFDAEEYTAITEFDDIVKAIDDNLDDLGPADDVERAKIYAQDDAVRKKTGETKYEAIMLTISGLTHETVSTAKVEKIAKLCNGFAPIEVNKIQEALCKYAKLSMSVVRRAFAATWHEETKREAFDNVPRDILGALEGFTTDIVPVAVATILKKKYRHGYTIAKGQDGAVYIYNGKIWEAIESDEVDGIAREALQMAAPGTENLAGNMDKCKKVMLSVLKKIDFTEPPSPNYDVFNFQNCEIWVDNMTGKKAKKIHNFRSHQTQMLKYDFDDNAKCPSFSTALPGILSCYGKSAAAVESHLWELYGYTLTRRKNQAAFVAITGPGGNGKSILLGAIDAVAGDSVLHGSLSDFGSGRSEHAFSQIVGKIAFVDDDAEYGTKLPNEVLKKLSESKRLTANPKYKKAFGFQANAICWLACNSWPYTGDTSNGIRRRAHIFNLTNEFVPGVNADLSLPEKTIAEAPGIFNLMIEGLIRFRKRGHFEAPAALAETAVEWESRTNPVAAYIIEKGENGKSLSDNYAGYQEFTFDTGRRDRISLPRFREMCEALGCKSKSGKIIFPERLLNAKKGLT